MKNRSSPRQSPSAAVFPTRSHRNPAAWLGGGALALWLASPSALAVCVNNVAELQAIGTDTTSLAGTYELCADIDASDTSNWNSGDGFWPLGSSSAPFTGSFDGQGHVITGLTIHTTANFVGLFGATDTTALVQRVGLVDVAILGVDYVGALVGNNLGTIRESYATGSVAGLGSIGGLVGYNEGGIENSYSIASVTGDTGGDAIGALVGYNTANITDSYATGSVSAPGGTNVGGLIGEAVAGVVTDSTTTPSMAALPLGWSLSVWGNGDNQTTPYLLALRHNAVYTVNDGAAPSDVVQNVDQLQAMNQNLAGRYVLGNDIDASVTATWIGGFIPVGRVNENTFVPNAPFTGKFDGLGHTISNLFVDRDVNEGVGLFGNVKNALLRNVGLLNSNIYGGTEGTGALVGRIVNTSATAIHNSYADGGSVRARSHYVGGLVGVALANSSIDYSYANVSVESSDGGGTTDAVAGGLAGFSNGYIAYSYASGSVTGNAAIAADNKYIGGLVGRQNGGSIIYSYATGAVSAVGGGTELAGLIGRQDSGAVTGSYWDTDTTGQATSAGGAEAIGLTTEQWLTDGPLIRDPANWTTGAWVPGNPYPGLRVLPYITIVANGSQTYGGAASLTTGSMLDQDGADASALVDTDNLVWTLATTTIADAGTTVAIAGEGATATASGYQLIYTGSLTVAQAPLTITANAVNKDYDGVAYSGGDGVSYSGFVNGDTAAVLTGVLSYGGSAQGAISPGTYVIAPSGLAAVNYALTYVDGALSIAALAPDEIIASPDAPLTLSDLTPVIAPPGSILVIPRGANLEGLSITLQRPPGTGGSAPITIRIGSLTLTLSEYVDGTELSLKRVLVDGVKTLVLVVTGGELNLSGVAGQPLVTLNGTVVLSAAADGSTLRFSAAADGDGSGSIAVVQGRILISGMDPVIGDGLIYAGETADFDATGKIARLRLASAPGATGGVGDPLTLDLAPNLAFITAVPQLHGNVARLGGSFLDALADLLGSEPISPQTNGVLVLDLGGRRLHALPVGDIVIDMARADGLHADADGLVSIAIGGVVVRFAPALPGLVELAQGLPAGATITVRDGLLLAQVGGKHYVVRPGWNGLAASGAGLGSSDGALHYTWQGLRYPLHAAFADYESVVDAAEQAWPGAVAFTNADGSVLLLKDGMTLLAVPALMLEADADGAGDALWWRDADGTLYLRNADGSVQALQLLPL